jgi:hypothetical protein
MKDSVRRIVMLGTILTFGLILIFIDVTLVQLFLMMVILVIVLPFLLGIATIAEVRAGLANMKKPGILRRLDEMKFFEKKNAPAPQKVPPKPEKKPEKPAKAAAPKPAGTNTGFGAHLKTFISSFGSLGTILKERTKSQKKVEDINKMLDKTVSEKVPRPPAPSDTMASSGKIAPPSGTGGAGMSGFSDEEDPFLSLSNDGFDDGLLEEMEADVALPASGSLPDIGGEPSSAMPEPELLMPSFDSPGGAEETPSGAAAGLDEFSGLDGGDMDDDFGNLDELSLDDVELDEGTEPAAASPAPDASPVPEIPAPAAAPPEDSSAVKTAWIPSDAPKDMGQTEDQIGVQSDMASFAGGASGTDEDLLSSIASDVKTVKKDKDVSLLRELKDFKAPAVEIETELTGLYQKMGADQKPRGKSVPPTGGTK